MNTHPIRRSRLILSQGRLASLGYNVTIEQIRKATERHINHREPSAIPLPYFILTSCWENNIMVRFGASIK